MRTMLTIAVHEFKAMYRRRMFQIVTVGVPVGVLIALSVVWVIQNVGDDDGEKDKAGYVDGTTLFSGHLTQDDIVFVRYETREEGMSAMLAKDVKRLYIIPPDYLVTGSVQRIEVGPGFSLNQGEDGRFSGFLLANLTDAAPESEVIERLKDPLLLTNVAVDSSGGASRSGRSAGVLLPGAGVSALLLANDDRGLPDPGPRRGEGEPDHGGVAVVGDAWAVHDREGGWPGRRGRASPRC